MMIKRLLLSFYSIFIAMTLLAPPVLQLLEVDLGSWSYVDTSEEEQKTSNPYELQEKLLSSIWYETLQYSEESNTIIISNCYASGVSTFSGKIVLPPPEITL